MDLLQLNGLYYWKGTVCEKGLTIVSIIIPVSHSISMTTYMINLKGFCNSLAHINVTQSKRYMVNRQQQIVRKREQWLRFWTLF